MYLKPYFYYRQQYPSMNRSNNDSVNSEENECKEVTYGAKDVGKDLDQAAVVEKDKDETRNPKVEYEHTRFQEVAPGIFQFKHPRPPVVKHLPAPVINRYVPEFLAHPSQEEKKTNLNEFVRIGTFPGVAGYGLPVYQFT
jgi:hypothetical protein